MTQFDEAIQKAVIEIVFESPHSPHPEEIAAFVDDVITRHFAEIEAVFGKLVELAVCNQEMQKKDGKWLRAAKRIAEILADPQVKAAIERSEG